MVSRMPMDEHNVTSTIQHNLSVAEGLLEKAADKGAQLAVLPENVLTFGCRKPFQVEEQLAWLQSFGALARKYNSWLVAGSLPLVEFQFSAGDLPGDIQWQAGGALPFASSVVFDNDGRLAAVYRKCHLFDADVSDGEKRYRESEFFQPGNEPMVVKTPWGMMGLAICYDLRFPEYFSRLVQSGAEFVVLPSAFTYVTGKAHWEILLRARAIENQLFMVGVNQAGQHNSQRKTWGDSMIVDPWGKLLNRAGNPSAADDSQLGCQVVLATLEFSEVSTVRQKMPVGQHHRF